MRFYIIVLSGLYILFNNGKLKIDKGVKYIMIWFGFECITLVWARDYEIFRLHFLTMIGFVVLLLCITQPPIDKKLITNMVYSFWIGSFLIGFLSLFFHSTYHFQSQFSARQVLTLRGVQTDPNNQAIFLMYGISISLYYLFVRREKKIFCIGTIVINMISMMMTGSRGGFLSFGVMVFIVIFFVVKDWKTKIWSIIATIVIVLLIVRFAPSILNSATLERLIQFDEYEGGGNRVTIWKNALTLINENPFYYLVGAGWGSYNNYNGWAGIHNTYLEIFCNTGSVGLILFFFPIVHIVRKLWKNENYLPIFIVISVSLPALFIDCINKRFFWNAIYFLFASYIFMFCPSQESDRSETV